MAKEKLTKSVEQTPLTSEIEKISSISTFSVVKTENVGTMVKNYIEVPIKEKDENGEEITVYRKCRDVVAVTSLQTIGMLSDVRKKSLKYIVLGMAKITDAHAQAVDKKLKTAKALISHVYPDYSDNTINKYRRIGLLFGNNAEDISDFSYKSYIDEDVSISNLDVILTLFNNLDVEKTTPAEREKAVSDFYAKYIVTDMIHLHASQSVLKKEVHDILNPAIEGTAKELDSTAETAQTDSTAETAQTDSTAETAQTDSTAETAQIDSTAETAQHSIATLTLIFKGNKTAEDALAVLMEELSKLF